MFKNLSLEEMNDEMLVDNIKEIKNRLNYHYADEELKEVLQKLEHEKFKRKIDRIIGI
jgi:DNA-binding transcriptional regulator GbsR (MarR family)